MSFGLGVQTLLPFWPDLKGGPLVALAALEVFRDFPAIPRSSLRKVTTVRDQQNDPTTAQRLDQNHCAFQVIYSKYHHRHW